MVRRAARLIRTCTQPHPLAQAIHSLVRAAATLRRPPQSNCFKGEFKVSNSSALGKADLKKLRERILDEFPNCSKKELDRVLPTKDVDISVLKLSNGTTLYVAGEGKPPAFFDDGFGGLYPTLFTLWRLPHMMEELVTHGPVSKFLLPKDRSAGADMMLPGVIVPDEGLGAVHVGQKRCVRVEGNAMPFAVGKMIVSDADITSKGMKGKGMNVLHVYKDSLWASPLGGGRKVPNSGFGADQISPADDERPSGGAEPIDLDDAGAAEEEDDDDDADAADAEAAEPVVEMPPDELIEYCFFAALKSTCTDAELPITADKFYSHHMQPARPAGHPPLDAKKTQHKQIGKFIKAMHKAKLIKVTEVKSEIKIVSVDRASAKYVEFAAKGAGEKEKKEEAKKAAAEAAADKGGAAGGKAGGGIGGAEKKEEAVVVVRSKPPAVTTVLQPNSYTKGIFEAMGRDKNGSYSADECNKVLRGYVETKLGPPTTKCNRDGDAATGAERPSGDAWDDDDEAATEVRALLTRVGVPAAQLDRCAAALAADGYDSPRALEVAALPAAALQTYGGMGGDAAAALAAALAGKLPAAVVELLTRLGMTAAEAATAATALATDGFDSAAALRLLRPSEAAGYGVPAKLAEKLVVAAAAAADGGGAGGAGGDGAPRAPVDMARVPLDDLLLESLVKVAGGAKKGTVYPSHLALAELQARMAERMTQMYKMQVEGEAPAIKKGAIKPIKIEMKRAAGHNKTHVSGLESFLISPDAVSQLLKVKLGCTTAVLKLPGNNVKEQEIILQGHCVNEVVDYLRDAYCIDRSWIDLGKELDRKGKKIQAPTL